jgi:hypothetical protein
LVTIIRKEPVVFEELLSRIYWILSPFWMSRPREEPFATMAASTTAQIAKDSTMMSRTLRFLDGLFPPPSGRFVGPSRRDLFVPFTEVGPDI